MKIFGSNKKTLRRQRRRRIIRKYEAILDAMNCNYKYNVDELTIGPSLVDDYSEHRSTEYAAIRLLRAKYPVLGVRIKYATISQPEWAEVAEMGEASLNYKAAITW